MDLSLTSPPVRSPQAVYDRLVALGASDPDGRPGFLKAMVFRAARNGALSDISFCWQIAQAAHETADTNPKTGKFGPFNSKIWRERGNPGGIAVTDTIDYGVGFPDGIVAADAHHAHLGVYIFDDDEMPAVVREMKHLDPRWDAVVQKGWQGTVKTVDDLTGKWATDKDYGAKLRQRFTWVIEGAKVDPSVPTPQPEGTPVANTYGRVPKFGYVDRQAVTANKPEGQGWDNLGKRDVLGVVLHRMLGSLAGTDQFFRTANALTDFGLGVAATDGSDLAGVIYQWNDPFGYRSGWASGPYKGAWGDGLAFGQKYSVNAINRRLVSVEISGQQNTPIDAFAWGKLVHFVAYFADQCKVPWETFPLNPATGISFVFWHQEFTLGSGKECPFKWVMDNTDRLIADVKEMLRKAQTGDVLPAPAPNPMPTPAPTPVTFGPEWGTGAVLRCIADPYANVRWEPGTRFGIRDKMQNGETGVSMYPNPVESDGYHWFAVDLPGSREGWVAGEFLEVATPAPRPKPEPEPTPEPEPLPVTDAVVTFYEDGSIVWHKDDGDIVIRRAA